MLVAEYKKHLEARHLAGTTVHMQMQMLESFLAWFGTRNKDLRDITLDDLLAYRQWLARPRKSDGQPNSKGYQWAQLRCAKRYLAFLKKRGKLLVDPGEKLPALHKPKTLPKGVITSAQVMRLLRLPNTGEPFGFRDRTLMEVLFSCGLRGREVCKLQVYDFDPDKRTLRIIQAKGRKDRVVPVGKAASEYLKEYIARVRPVILEHGRRGGGVASMFLSRTATPLAVHTLWKIIRQYRNMAGLPEEVTTHSLRHACATGMLQGGASVRHVQEMLGHASLITTQVYTRVVPTDLKKVHAKTSPSERRKNRTAPHFELKRRRARR